LERREFPEIALGSLAIAAHPAAALAAPRSWVGILRRTPDGAPVPFEPYRITSPAVACSKAR
jgi:hypothetical protein